MACPPVPPIASSREKRSLKSRSPPLTITKSDKLFPIAWAYSSPDLFFAAGASSVVGCAILLLSAQQRSPREHSKKPPLMVKYGPDALEAGCRFCPRKQTSVSYASDCDV